MGINRVCRGNTGKYMWKYVWGYKGNTGVCRRNSGKIHVGIQVVLRV